MKYIVILAALACIATFAIGTVKTGSKNISAHHSKIEKILEDAK